MSDFYDDEFFEEGAKDDLSDVTESEEMPSDGWYRTKVLSISTRPTKKGADMRTATLKIMGTGHEAKEFFAIGVEGRGGGIARRRYRTFARCCGIEELDGKFSFSTSDIEGADLYARFEQEKQEGYGPSLKAREFRPITEEPDDVVDTGTHPDDETPF